MTLFHALASAVLAGLTLWILHRTELYRGASRRKRMLIVFVAIFVVIGLLNVLWPYSTS